MAAAQVVFRREQQVHHQADDLARREMLSGFFVRLLCPNADELFKHVAHLHVVHAFRGEIYPGECLHHLIKKVFLRHACDLLSEGEALHDFPDIGRKTIDVLVQPLGELLGVVEHLAKIEAGKIVERVAGDLFQKGTDHFFRLTLDACVLFKDLFLCWTQ